MGPRAIRIAVFVATTVLAGGAAEVAAAAPVRAIPERVPLAAPVACTGCWIPAPVTSWQWQLTTPVDQSVAVTMYDIDLFENAASVVSSLHAKGRKVVCYLDAGTWEDFRPDADQFPSSVLGSSNGWPDERWLDIRQLSVLRPIMRARLDQCDSKGFDAVEFDNVDGYANDSGFPLVGDDQVAFNTFLANEAHKRGLSAALKNDLDQVGALLPYFDWALDEQCFEFSECGLLKPFTNAGKAVMEVEYSGKTSDFCPRANKRNFNSMKKRLSLNAWRTPCR